MKAIFKTVVITMLISACADSKKDQANHAQPSEAHHENISQNGEGILAELGQEFSYHPENERIGSQLIGKNLDVKIHGEPQKTKNGYLYELNADSFQLDDAEDQSFLQAASLKLFHEEALDLNGENVTLEVGEAHLLQEKKERAAFAATTWEKIHVVIKVVAYLEEQDKQNMDDEEMTTVSNTPSDASEGNEPRERRSFMEGMMKEETTHCDGFPFITTIEAKDTDEADREIDRHIHGLCENNEMPLAVPACFELVIYFDPDYSANWWDEPKTRFFSGDFFCRAEDQQAFEEALDSGSASIEDLL